MRSDKENENGKSINVWVKEVKIFIKIRGLFFYFKDKLYSFMVCKF